MYSVINYDIYPIQPHFSKNLLPRTTVVGLCWGIEVTEKKQEEKIKAT